MATSTLCPPSWAVAQAIRLHPALSPSAACRHWPSAMQTSSVVWWSSMNRSPRQDTSRRRPDEEARAETMASRV
eukprot:scaffold14082_cov99-Isochrysis_galbana.AAC.4